MIDTSLSDWLLDSDPALRWQVERDLLGIDEDIWQETRGRVRVEGRGGSKPSGLSVSPTGPGCRDTG